MTLLHISASEFLSLHNYTNPVRLFSCFGYKTVQAISVSNRAITTAKNATISIKNTQSGRARQNHSHTRSHIYTERIAFNPPGEFHRKKARCSARRQQPSAKMKVRARDFGVTYARTS